MADDEDDGVNLAPEEAPGVSGADAPAGPEFEERGRDDDDDDDDGDESPPPGGGRGGGGGGEAGVGADDGYDSNAREYDVDDLDYNGYDDEGVNVDGDDVGYDDDIKAKAGGRDGGGGEGDEVEEEIGGGGALGIISYLWMLVALALFAYLIMKVQEQAVTIKVLQRRVASLETRLGLQPMMPMEMQNQKM